MNFLGKVMKVVGQEAVMDPDLARMAGAMMVAGPEDALAALRKRLEAGALHAEAQKNPGLSFNAVRWLAHGERGISSDTMFTVITGVDALKDWHKSHPYDPADFSRCRLLLEQVPELKPLFVDKMREVSKEWLELVRQWDNICQTMDEEAPKWRDGEGSYCPKTYELIKRAIDRPKAP